MSRLRNLPKDLLIELLENVEDRKRLSKEELKKRIELDQKELHDREEKEKMEVMKLKNDNVRRILLNFGIFFDIFNDCEVFYYRAKERKEIESQRWRFSVDEKHRVNFIVDNKYKIGPELTKGHDFENLLCFLNSLDINGVKLVSYIQEYFMYWDYPNHKPDKWNIFYSNFSSKEVSEYLKKCKKCKGCEISNYGPQNLYLFYSDCYGAYDLYETLQINDEFLCIDCVKGHWEE